MQLHKCDRNIFVCAMHVCAGGAKGVNKVPESVEHLVGDINVLCWAIPARHSGQEEKGRPLVSDLPILSSTVRGATHQREPLSAQRWHRAMEMAASSAQNTVPFDLQP